MFLPARMSSITMLVYDTDVEKVTTEILRLGMLQLSDATEVKEWAEEMPSVVNEEKIEKYVRLEERIKGLAAKLGRPISMKPGKTTVEDIDAGEITDYLEETEKAADEYITRKRRVRQEVSRLMSLLSETRSGFSGALPVDIHGPFSFLEVRAVRISGKNMPTLQSLLKGIPSVVLPIGGDADKRDCLIMVLRKDRRTLDDALREVSFTKIELPKAKEEEFDEEVAAEIRDKILKQEKDLDEINEKLRSVADRKMEKLAVYLSRVHTRKVVHQAQKHFKRTSRTFMISGWVPNSRKAKLISRVKSITGDRCYIEEVSAEELGAKVEVPVMFENPAFLKPFEFLTSTYGIPKYNTIDPTLFLAISFFAMFGVMFGDVGHGAVLGILGLLLFKKSQSQDFRKLGGLLMYSGIAAMIFGFIYGSFFGPSGLSHLLPYEGFEPIRNIRAFLKFAIYFGIGFLTLGIILNIINCVRTKDFFFGVFSREGLLGGVIYWISIILIARLFLKGSVGIDSRIILLLVFGPIVLFFLRQPIKKIFRPREPMFHEGVMLYIMESFVELIEIYTGYLANTLSFIRVAAFAMAHGGLFITVYAVTEDLSALAGAPIHVVGNCIIIILEGLIVGIQSVRLEYYEFFGKFFKNGQ